MSTSLNLLRSLRKLVLLGLIPLFCLAAHAAPPSTSNQKQGVTMSTNPRVKMTTNQGDIIISLDAAKAPKTVANFLAYVNDGFFDGTIFHRVIDGFMAQTGCPHGTGTGGSNYPNLKQEFNPEPHVRGTCSMARSSNPDSANSQFFICFDDARFLDRQYTVWGEVVEGMENVDKIKRGEPVRDPDSIVKASVVSL